jgi:hypothetical protein
MRASACSHTLTAFMAISLVIGIADSESMRMEDTASPLNNLIYLESECGASKFFRSRECGDFLVRASSVRICPKCGRFGALGTTGGNVDSATTLFCRQDRAIRLSIETTRSSFEDLGDEGEESRRRQESRDGRG